MLNCICEDDLGVDNHCSTMTGRMEATPVNMRVCVCVQGVRGMWTHPRRVEPPSQLWPWLTRCSGGALPGRSAKQLLLLVIILLLEPGGEGADVLLALWGCAGTGRCGFTRYGLKGLCVAFFGLEGLGSSPPLLLSS